MTCDLLLQVITPPQWPEEGDDISDRELIIEEKAVGQERAVGQGIDRDVIGQGDPGDQKEAVGQEGVVSQEGIDQEAVQEEIDQEGANDQREAVGQERSVDQKQAVGQEGAVGIVDDEMEEAAKAADNPDEEVRPSLLDVYHQTR